MSTATSTMALRSERVASQSIIGVTFANEDGASDLRCELPAGFGDCLLLDVLVDAGTIATIMANHQLHGPRVTILDATGGSNADFVGTDYWRQTWTDWLTARIVFDQVVYWRQGEALRLRFAEVDTNVTPTADIDIHARVRRLRQSVRERADPDRLGRIVLTT